MDLSEKEVHRALQFCSKFFSTTSQEQRNKAIEQGFAKGLFDVSTPFVDPAEIEAALHREKVKGTNKGESVKAEMEHVNARRVLHLEHAAISLELEAVDSHVVRLEHGSLGLKKV